MKGNLRILSLLLIILSSGMNAQEKLLIFHKTEGYRHQSIGDGIQAIERIANEDNYEVEVTQDSRYFTQYDLENIDLIIFLNTTGDVLNRDEQVAFENYMDGGGNFFGIHAAADTEYDWNWYGRLVGAYFQDHPEVQKAELIKKMPNHIAVERLPNNWVKEDEWYNYKDIQPDLQVMLAVDEASYKGGKNGSYHPIAWFQNYFGGGISIYTGMGHTAESYSDPDFLNHLSKCIEFALSN